MRRRALQAARVRASLSRLVGNGLRLWHGEQSIAELGRAARLRVDALGMLAAIAASVLLLFAGPSLRQPVFDLLQRVLPAPKASTEVVVVAIDAASLSAVEAWPWSRYVLARMTEEIASRGARAIAFDVIFTDPDRVNPEEFVQHYPEMPPAVRDQVLQMPSPDSMFAAVLGRAPTVLGRVGFETEGDEGGTLLPPAAAFAGEPPQALPSYPRGMASLEIFDGAALGHGLLNGRTDPDGAVRRVPVLAKVQGILTPSLALEAVRIAEGVETIRLTPDGSGARVAVGRRRFHIDARGDLTLRFVGRGAGVAAHRVISAADVFRAGLPADVLRDKIVLVGLMATGSADLVTTPTAQTTYGLLVQAQAIDAMLTGRNLVQPMWAKVAPWFAGIVLTLLAWFAVPRSAMATAIAVGVFALVLGFAVCAIAFQAGVLLDPFPIFAPVLATSAAMVATLFVEGRTVQSRLRTDLDGERLAAARVAGELAAATGIQMGMLLPRHELAGLHPAVEVDAVLEPARTVGGDLYDAFMLDDVRLCFLVGDVTGKGVPAALFMAVAKAHARSFLIGSGDSLGDAVARVNDALSRDNGQDMFVTFLAGILDTSNGALELCRAGHENPIVLTAGGEVRPLSVPGGPPLCAMPDIPYRSTTYALAVGETLVTFTDGVTEAATPADELYGRERLCEAAARAHESATDLPGLVDELVADVRRFEAGADATDDLAILAVRRR